MVLDYIILFILICILAVLIWILKKSNSNNQGLLRLSEFENKIGQFDTSFRDEFSRNRNELDSKLISFSSMVDTKFSELSDSLLKSSSDMRLEVGNALKDFANSFRQQSDKLSEILEQKIEFLNKNMSESAKESREELKTSLSSFSTQLSNSIKEFNETQDKLKDNIGTNLNTIRDSMDKKLKDIQEDNSKKLEQMRETVDEKLNKTLEDRLGASFKQVSDRLEIVHKSLGEMSTLANGVGDLKKVLSNVKTKGIVGEYQLYNILEQVLAPSQYEQNVAVKKGSQERVEFGIRIPSKDSDDKYIYLPIDAKFPTDNYERLMAAYEKGDTGELSEYSKALENNIKKFAKDIRDKYINPPVTTDFAIMFLPFEGLYAEVIRIPALLSNIQSNYNVIITGPSTILALLNSLQMGFRTLAIEKKSGEIGKTLFAVKKDFEKFAKLLDKTKQKINEAGNTLDEIGHRNEQINKKLKKFDGYEELPESVASSILGAENIDE